MKAVTEMCTNYQVITKEQQRTQLDWGRPRKYSARDTREVLWEHGVSICWRHGVGRDDSSAKDMTESTKGP